MKDRRPYSLLQIRGLGHRDPRPARIRHERLPLCSPSGSIPTRTYCRSDRHAETLVLVVQGSLTIVWHELIRVTTELGERDTALTNPAAVGVLLAGAEGATLLAMVIRSQARSA